MKITDPPRALAVPKQGKIEERDEIVLVELLGLLEHQYTGLFGPFNHETLVLKDESTSFIAIEAE